LFDYPPIEQAAVILKSSRQKQMARQFLDFLQTPAILEIMRNYGFSPPLASTSSH
jgi:ABC-type molybdate transport system substrate-binding protein